jgi:NAD(P)-dependent dehydrogenase (short-subunit alcohol dehydrogenase family)
MDLGFAGSKAVVTGGSKGMGLAIAETLAAEGASVAVMARNKAALERWGQLNSLVHTIGPGDGYFEQLESLAKEGILVNCVCPGTVVTASFTEQLSDVLAAEGLDATNPHDVMTWVDNNFHQPCDLGRAGLPEEIASITAYLASRRNGYVTGATVNVDGGSDFV